MYLLKQWPLKSSTPPCLSSSPWLLCSHLPNPSLYCLSFQLDLLLHKQLKAPIYCRGLKGDSLELCLCSRVASMKGLVFRGEPCLGSLKRSIYHWGTCVPPCPLRSPPLSSLLLSVPPTPFTLHLSLHSTLSQDSFFCL